MSKLRGLVWVGVVTVAATAAAVGLPTLARHVPWAVERTLGRMAGEAQGGLCRAGSSTESIAAFDQLVKRVYPRDAVDRSLPVSIDIVRGNTVNAFATLGGHIYVFDGLLQQMQSPEELAGVLAHEVEHVRARHIIQGAVVNLVTFSGVRALVLGDASDTATAASVLLSLRFSRDQEDEADRRALERLRRSGVDAAGLSTLFARLQQSTQPPALLSNHPTSSSRARLAANSNGYPVTPVLDADAWARAKQICHPRGDTR